MVQRFALVLHSYLRRFPLGTPVSPTTKTCTIDQSECMCVETLRVCVRNNRWKLAHSHSLGLSVGMHGFCVFINKHYSKLQKPKS